MSPRGGLPGPSPQHPRIDDVRRPLGEELSARWGDVDAEDALTALDAVVADGLADPDRIGVMGLSYGGFLTQWLLGITDRFSAAIAENGVANQVSAWGTRTSASTTTATPG